MILLLIIAAWILVLSLVTGLCAAARMGDQQLAHVSAPARWGRAEPAAWEHAEPPAISARANASTVRPAQSDASLVHSGGVAA